MLISGNVDKNSKALFILTRKVDRRRLVSHKEGRIEVKKQKVRKNACLLFTFIIILATFPMSHANANLNIDEFPLGMVLEYQSVYKYGGGLNQETYTVRFEVTRKLESIPPQYIVIRNLTQSSGTTVQTFYENYPNSTLSVHESAPLWINLTSWMGLESVTLGWRVYNITSITSAGCTLHHEMGKDEDTITYESHGILAQGYFFHFDIDNPLSTNSLSTKLVSSNLNPPIIFEQNWLLTTLLLPAIAIELVIIGWLVKKRKTSIEL
ncbi:MAG: hypothetical protein EAX87_00750 [Candidatus Thorarchaeota archaeon]|nr:hypothetical protein [Candidatus Thorarchaeota archaeon]